jgi:ribosome-binding protein aMBF1 (putative translation factor)
MSKQFRQQLVDAIERSGRSRYAISQETGIPQATLSRFVHGQAGLSVEAINKLCKALGLRLVGPAKRMKKEK